MDVRRILRLRGQYDPLAFPESGPDKTALSLQRQGAPGAPAQPGTCMVRIKCQVFESERPCQYRAETSLCGKGWLWRIGADALPRLGEPAQKLAERDAEAHFGGHICDR